MPCEYHSPGEKLIEVERRLGKSSDVINRLTALLCNACRVMEESDVDIPMELAAWWHDHKAADEDRIKREAEYAAKKRKDEERREYMRSVRDRLMEQLTPDEKKALGLY